MFDCASFCTKENMGDIRAFNKMHSVKVANNSNGKVSFWYKEWSRHRVWKPFVKDIAGEQLVLVEILSFKLQKGHLQ